MKSLSKIFAFTLVAASTSLAHAVTLTGTINMSSNPYISATVSNTGVVFYNNLTMTGTGAGTGAESTTYGTGDFGPTGTAAISPNDSVTLPDQILISSLVPYNPMGGINQGLTVFSFTQVTSATTSVNYRFKAFSASEFTGGVPGYAFFGELEAQYVNTAIPLTTMFSVVNTASEFDLTNAGSTTNIAFSSVDISPTPEPNSLILLGTGLVSAAGVVMRKRRMV